MPRNLPASPGLCINADTHAEEGTDEAMDDRHGGRRMRTDGMERGRVQRGKFRERGHEQSARRDPCVRHGLADGGRDGRDDSL